VNRPHAPQSRRRAFNIPELLIALAINAMLLLATLIALNASYNAYSRTTEVASTHTVGRLVMSRMLTMIRTGTEFGPFPASPLTTTVQSDYIEFLTPQNELMILEWDSDEEALYVELQDPVSGTQITRQLLLEGVLAQTDSGGNPVHPFTLEFVKGRYLYRATLDLTIRPDDNQATNIDADNSAQTIRLVASAMPRTQEY
jgi:hypothetical protein